MSIHCAPIFAGAGVGRQANSIDWHPSSNFGALACGSTVALVVGNEPNTKSTLDGYKIVHTAHWHSKKIVCIKWLTEDNNCQNLSPILCSADADASVCVWHVKNFTLKLHCAWKKAHEEPILYTCGIQFDGYCILATSASDGKIKLWSCPSTLSTDHVTTSENEVQLEFTSNNGTMAPLVLAMCVAQLNDNLLIFTGGHDSVVAVWMAQMKQLDKCKPVLSLAGHKDWIRAVTVKPVIDSDKCLYLASSSQDTHIRIWRIAKGVDEVCRHGDIATKMRSFELKSESGQTETYNVSLDAILSACAYNGGLHFWQRANEEATAFKAKSPGIGGHSGKVTDLDWEPKNGSYLLTCGADMTTRLWAPCQINDNFVSVRELARPQVHGYEMQCLKCVQSGRFVSASEEKLLRAFAVPSIFVENWKTLVPEESQSINLSEFSGTASASGAGVPSLGLSNKAVYAKTDDKNEFDVDNDISNSDNEEDSGQFGDENLHFNPVKLEAPPTEDHLMQNTLWPEEHKLYGHGLEVYTVTSNESGSLLASSSKASQPSHAAIHLWHFDRKRDTWHVANKIETHKLTVTSLRFASANECENELLLSASRDRTWAIHLVQKDGTGYSKLAGGSGHSRIIWDCAWMPDASHFVTVARDKKVIIWKFCHDDAKTDQSITARSSEVICKSAVTAVDVTQLISDENCKWLLSVGLEDGSIEIHLVNSDGDFGAHRTLEKEWDMVDFIVRCNVAGVYVKLHAPAQSFCKQMNFAILNTHQDVQLLFEGLDFYLIALCVSMLVTVLFMFSELLVLSSAIAESPPGMFLAMIAQSVNGIAMGVLAAVFATLTVLTNKTNRWKQLDKISPKLQTYWHDLGKYSYEIGEAQKKLSCCGWPEADKHGHFKQKLSTLDTSHLVPTPKMEKSYHCPKILPPPKQRETSIMCPMTKDTMKTCCLSALDAIRTVQCDPITHVWPNVTAEDKVNIYRVWDCPQYACGVLLTILLLHTQRFNSVGIVPGLEGIQEKYPDVYDVASMKPRSRMSRVERIMYPY